ncbi:hypothetical protein SAMN05444162_0828 [Paenibacillaceae bacterium GAS479]|nr:hypothetical protein SAMN05444162_0828 [Paenibacillaceae bacterium GAS479]
MRIMLRQAAMELRSLMLLRWTLLLPAAAAVWMILHTWRLRPESSQDVNLYAADTHIMLLMLTTAIPLLLGVLLIRRDLLHPSAEWLFRLPVSAGGWMASKWLAGFAYMTLYTVAVSAAYAASALRHDVPPYSIWRQIGLYALMYEQAFALSLALGLFLGVLLPLRFSLPAAFCAWVFGSLFLQTYIRPVYELGWLKAFYLQPLFNNSLIGNEAWSFILAKGEMLRIILFGAVFAIFLLTAGAALLGRSKPPLNRRRPWLLTLAALLASTAAFLPFSSLNMERNEHREQLEAAAAQPDELQEPAPYRFQLDRMKLQVNSLPEQTGFEAQATLDIPTIHGKLLPAEGNVLLYRKESTVSLLLYSSLEVRSVELNGVPITWERQGDRIQFSEDLLNPYQYTQTVEITYNGGLDEWLSGAGGSESYLAFTRKNAVYLPASLGWYPLPGGDTLLALGQDQHLQDRPASNITPNTEYEVVLSGFETQLFGTIQNEEVSSDSTRFGGVSDSGLTVVGGRFQRIKLAGEPIEIVTTPGNADEANDFLKRFTERRKGLETLTGAPLNSVRQIFFFPMHMIGTPMETPSITRSWYAENDTLFIPQTEHRNLDSYAEDALSTLLLFGDTGRGAENARKEALAKPSVALEIRSAYAYLYNKESGDKDPYRLQADETPEWKAIQTLIDAAYERGHAGQIHEVLERLRQFGLTLPEPPRSAAGEWLATDAVPYITMNDFMREWRKLMPDDRLPVMPQVEGG